MLECYSLLDVQVHETSMTGYVMAKIKKESMKAAKAAVSAVPYVLLVSNVQVLRALSGTGGLASEHRACII